MNVIQMPGKFSIRSEAAVYQCTSVKLHDGCMRCRAMNAAHTFRVSAFVGDSNAVTARLCAPCVKLTEAGRAIVEAI
jgi:hypothetical protein